jgi:hypothetical protein
MLAHIMTVLPIIAFLNGFYLVHVKHPDAIAIHGSVLTFFA